MAKKTGLWFIRVVESLSAGLSVVIPLVNVQIVNFDAIVSENVPSWSGGAYKIICNGGTKITLEIASKYTMLAPELWSSDFCVAEAWKATSR